MVKATDSPSTEKPRPPVVGTARAGRLIDGGRGVVVCCTSRCDREGEGSIPSDHPKHAIESIKPTSDVDNLLWIMAKYATDMKSSKGRILIAKFCLVMFLLNHLVPSGRSALIRRMGRGSTSRWYQFMC